MSNYGTNTKNRNCTFCCCKVSLRKTTQYIVGRSPTPIVIYSVEGELDSPTIKDDNRQNLDNTQNFNNGMMWSRGGDGERKHLLQEALPTFVQDDSYMIHLLGKIYIYWHCEDISNRMGRRGKLSIILFLPIMNLLLSVLQKMGSRIWWLQKKVYVY